MTYLNILEKIKILFNTLLDFKIILIFSGLLLFLTLLRIIKKLSNKRYTKCIILSLIISLLISILDNEKSLSNTFNNFTTLFFRGIYFPSVYVYLGIITIILISTIITLLNKNTKKIYKIINSTTFILNSMLFILILNIIAKNKIDVFSINSLYINTPLVVTLEISTGLFLLWISLLLIAYTTNCIIERMTYKEEIIKVEVNNIPEEINIIKDIEPTIVPTEVKSPVEVVNNVETIKRVNIVNNNYVHIPVEQTTLIREHNDNISFQDLLEKISKLEKIDGNIDDIDIFTDNKYNVFGILS